MKKLSFFALSAAALLLGACSSDNDLTNGAGKAISTDGDGYIGFAIQLPNELTPTKANTDFNDGDAAEFEVKSGKVLYFVGDNEADAEFIMAYDIVDPATGWQEDGSEQVTTTKSAVTKIDKSKFTIEDNLYAYVVLNYKGTALDVNPKEGTKFSAYSIQTLAAAEIGATDKGVIGANGLLMTNSPISDKQGGSANPTGAVITTAVILNQAAIKETAAEAAANPAGCVFVERAAAKVQVAQAENVATPADILKDGETLKIKEIVWQVINTEKEFYNARQANVAAWLPYVNADDVNANTKYRFVSSAQFSPQILPATVHTVAYRTFFAQDPNYNNDNVAGLVKPIANDADWLAVGDASKAYIPENTFPTLYQTHQNSTQVAIRVQFDGGDFYILSNDANAYDKENAQDKIQSNITSGYNVNNALAKADAYISKYLAVPAEGSATTPVITANPVVTFNSTAAGVVDYEYTVTYTDAAGNVYTLAAPADAEADVAAEAAAIQKELNDAVEAAKALNIVTLYANGYVYYNQEIQHFGEAETPWSAAGPYITQPGATTEQIYKLSDPNYGDNAFLGRYGIVRDNWYKLTVTAIKKLGTATPVTVANDNTPDDEIEKDYFIAAEVHILPWVIRNQNIEF